MSPRKENYTVEVTDFDSAVAAAIATVGQAPDERIPATENLLDDQASVESTDQAEVSEAQGADGDAEAPAAEEDLFGELEVPAPSAPRVDLAEQTHIVPGVEKPVTTQELKDGYLRNADATRKWQEAAQVRKQNEQAIKFWQALEADPIGVARTIAEQAGLLARGAAPQVAVDVSPLRTSEAVEAEVQRRVGEALSQHPVVLEAQAAKARSWLDGQFARLNELAGQPLSKADRSKILRTATEKGIVDLEIVFNALMAEKGRKQAAANSLRDVAPARQTSRAVTQEITTPADSFEEAARRAKAQTATNRR